MAAAAITAEALGWRFAVEAPPEIVGEVARVLRPLQSSGVPDARYRIVRKNGDSILLLLDGRLVGEHREEQGIVGALTWSVNREVEARTESHLLIHAGGVADAAGAVVIVGPSGAGKSTLTAALTQHGLGYVTDEAIAFSPSGTITPYPRSITLKGGTWRLLPHMKPPAGDVRPPFNADAWHVDPTTIGRVTDQRELTARLLVSIRRRPRTAPTARQLTPAETLALLLNNGLNLSRQPRRALSVLHDVSIDLPSFELAFDSVTDGVEVVQTLLDRHE